MKNKTILLALVVLAGCSGQASPSFSNVTLITPTGSPTLAFYDQGDNVNWLSTSTPADYIPAAFASGNYDTIVFDGVSGLTNIKKNKRDYVLATWITKGTFYVISNKHVKEDMVKSTATVDAFVKTGNASLSFNHLQNEVWNWDLPDTQISYESGVDMVRTNIVSNPDSFDYFIVAEPLFSTLKATIPTLNLIYDLQEEWGKAYNGELIPAAGLFVNKTSYGTKKNDLNEFIASVNSRIDNAIDNPGVAVQALNDYALKHEDDQKAVTKRFGFTVDMVSSLQAGGQNKFGLVKSGSISDLSDVANKFQERIGSQLRFDETCFITSL